MYDDHTADASEQNVVGKDEENSESKMDVLYCEALIIGAGVSGLQCAQSLTADTNNGPSLQYDDILVLEARQRIGGRVDTRQYKMPPGKNGANGTTDQEDDDGVLWIDNGAAWMHGVDPIPWTDDNNNNNEEEDDDFHIVNKDGQLENPALQYLDRNLDLNPLVPGNPWTRPYSVLHRTQNIAVFVQQPKPSDPTNGNSQVPFMFRNATKLPNQPDSLQNRNHVIDASARRHYQIMRRVAEQIQGMYMEGRGMEADAELSLLSSLNHWNQIIPVEEESRGDDHELTSQNIHALTSFHQHMLEYWQGFSLNEIPLGQYSADLSQNNVCPQDVVVETSNGDANCMGGIVGKCDPLWDDSAFRQDGDFGGPHCTVRGGMQKVVQNLCTTELRSRIQLGHEVVRIQKLEPPVAAEQDRDGDYTILAETRSGLLVYARSCLVTIPVGCLTETHQSLFANTTPLSAEKLESFQWITMGKYKKVFLAFDSIFWPAEPAFLGMALQPPKQAHDGTVIAASPLGTCLLIDNLWAKDGHACFEAILAGNQAVWATNKPTDAIRDTVLDFIQSAMNWDVDLKSSCVDCHVTRWEEDPYCRGAFSGLSIGGLSRHIDSYREPEWDGCLRFGGDASSFEFEGSVPAAIMSGKHAARGILNHLFGSRSIKG